MDRFAQELLIESWILYVIGIDLHHHLVRRTRLTR